MSEDGNLCAQNRRWSVALRMDLGTHLERRAASHDGGLLRIFLAARSFPPLSLLPPLRPVRASAMGAIETLQWTSCKKSHNRGALAEKHMQLRHQSSFDGCAEILRTEAARRSCILKLLRAAVQLAGVRRISRLRR